MADREPTNGQSKGRVASDLAAALVSRRRFLTETAKTACGVSLIGLAIAIQSNSSSALPPGTIRPPGALAEDDFLAACTRCGQCVRDCPYDILALADFGDPIGAGTPYFNPRKGPCEMCETIPCVTACPTGALDHKLTDINKSQMGLAVLIDQESCIAFQGLRCEVCFNVCPIRSKAIKLEFRHNKRSGKHALFIPVVYSNACTGCGLCERACILEEAAIKVLPVKLAKGELGRHYRLGWEQQKDAGGSLVTPDPEHRYNLLDGETYDHKGRGWSAGNSNNSSRIPPAARTGPATTPFSSNPLQTLNAGIKGMK